VGIADAPPVPMQLGNPERSDFRGYQVDLLGEIARRAGFRLGYRRALWSVIVSELLAGEINLICSVATVTHEREQEVDFCFPHLKLALAVVKRAGSSGGTAIQVFGWECGAEPRPRPTRDNTGYLSRRRYLSNEKSAGWMP